MSESEVVSLMESSRTAEERDVNADKVKVACKGYPEFWWPFWWPAVVQSGVMRRTAAKFGATNEIRIQSIA